MERAAPHIRPATADDTAALAALITHLTYHTTPDAMQARMAHIAADPAFATWVAEVEGAVVAMAGAVMGWTYNHDAPSARLLALVVDPAHRGSGIGAALVHGVEAWARSRGATALHLTTQNHRADAHRFYTRLGYADTGKRFHRELP